MSSRPPPFVCGQQRLAQAHAAMHDALVRAGRYVWRPAVRDLVLIERPRRLDRRSNAYLYYTDSDTWQAPIDDATMIRAATKSVSVSRCDTDLTGYFEGVLLTSGRCVEIEVQGEASSEPVGVKLPLPGPC